MWSVCSRSSTTLTLLTIVLSFAFFGPAGYAQWVVEDEGCRTPDRGVGNCIPLTECAPMVNVLKTLKRPISQTVLKKLQAYTCGPDKVGIKVCCPPGPISLDPNNKPSKVKDGPPDVSNHKNIKLLPKDCGYLDTDNKIINGVDAYLNEFPWMALLRYKGSIDCSTKNGYYLMTAVKVPGAIPLFMTVCYYYLKGPDIIIIIYSPALYTSLVYCQPLVDIVGPTHDTEKGLGFNCGGTIINKNYILTAGHCVTGLSSQLVSVRVGEHSIKNETDCETVNRKRTCNPPVQDLTIEEIIPHPQFGTKSFLNDIGLIRVSTINLDVVNARPVCLPLRSQKPYNTVTVTGWGVVNAETGLTSDILQKVGLPVAEKESCMKTYETHNIKLGPAQTCAGGVQNKDSCPGDSGGPMMVASIDDSNTAQYVQEGVVSFRPKNCGIPGYPGVYNLVRYYMDWILDNIKP